MSTAASGPRTRDETAALLARAITPGAYVNLGIGFPTLVANHIAPEQEVIFHSENGIVGMGPKPEPGFEHLDLTNAGKGLVTAVPGAAFIDSSLSFGIMRGGHLDYTVLGAYQVSQHGDIANWATNNPNIIPAVGGAMDLVAGAKHVFVMMELFTKKGECKIVRECTYPHTGFKCVERVYTDYAVFSIDTECIFVSDVVGISFDDLQAKCDVDVPMKHVH